uniref:C-type lectin domain-containing protein n=1 Tax=Periophthalmus magnuspinnatus TaxID=409849 RepID=A0A3B3Z7J5_9GOBI
MFKHFFNIFEFYSSSTLLTEHFVSIDNSSLTVVPAPLSALAPVSSRQFHFVYERKTQEEARNYCRQHYADLATVESMEDALILNKMANQRRLQLPDESPDDVQRAWIGLYDDINTWGWSLSDQAYYSKGQENYRNWYSGEPGNQGANQFCVCMYSDGLWRDERCTNRFTAICVDLTGEAMG